MNTMEVIDRLTLDFPDLAPYLFEKPGSSTSVCIGDIYDDLYVTVAIIYIAHDYFRLQMLRVSDVIGDNGWRDHGVAFLDCRDLDQVIDHIRASIDEIRAALNWLDNNIKIDEWLEVLNALDFVRDRYECSLTLVSGLDRYGIEITLPFGFERSTELRIYENNQLITQYISSGVDEALNQLVPGDWPW